MFWLLALKLCGCTTMIPISQIHNIYFSGALVRSLVQRLSVRSSFSRQCVFFFSSFFCFCIFILYFLFQSSFSGRQKRYVCGECVFEAQPLPYNNGTKGNGAPNGTPPVCPGLLKNYTIRFFNWKPPTAFKPPPDSTDSPTARPPESPFDAIYQL